ncbi:unnamed protein product [Paramecium sonneborni]|uniref:Uncharacterized protein n=1 Tax=Paramecium sonneborni TaxID=65129 RepID=A0A8S1QZ88_9CILI|nr:unnamed protein product [Paramecium sonneborni]
MIEQENKSYINLFNENQNLAESSYTDLEKLVQILGGNTLNLWNAQKTYIAEKPPMQKKQMRIYVDLEYQQQQLINLFIKSIKTQRSHKLPNYKQQ